MNKKLFLIKLVIILVMFGIGIYFYPKMPDMMPTHWNYNWVVDNYSSKNQAIFIFPGIALFLLVLFQFLPKLDPKKENYPKFEKTWEAFQFSLLIFFLYVYILTIFASLDKSINVGSYIMFGIGVLFMILGNYMWKIRQNYFVGIKLPWTLANEEVWNKTHRMWGKMFMLGWLLFIINSYFNITPWFMLFIILWLILVVPMVYSYLIFKRIEK